MREEDCSTGSHHDQTPAGTEEGGGRREERGEEEGERREEEGEGGGLIHTLADTFSLGSMAIPASIC